MTDEAAFQAALDEQPNNSGIRLVFADWLEEQGDPRATGYRWMGDNQRRPEKSFRAFLNGQAAHTDCWDWWVHQAEASDLSPAVIESRIHSVLPRPVFDALVGNNLRPILMFKEYLSRRDAELALCQVILTLPHESLVLLPSGPSLRSPAARRS